MNRVCPVCSDTEREILFTTPAEQHINLCCACGMVYADGSTPVDYAADSIYTCAATYSSQPVHYRSIALKILESGIPVNSSILDVGCALGGLMEMLQQVGFTNVKGISISPGEVAHCQAKGLKADLVDIAEAEAADVVILSHVLEHISNVTGFLANLREAANELIYIEVPNALSYSSHLTSLCQGFNSEHINHFDLSHLLIACLNSGMEVVRSGSYETPINDRQHYPVIWVLAKPANVSLKSSILDYSEKFSRQFCVVSERLRTFPRILAVWGVGQATQMLMTRRTLPPWTVHYATDTNPVFHGRRLGQAVIVAPTDFHPPAEVPILICSQLSQETIRGQIKALNLPNQILTLEA